MSVSSILPPQYNDHKSEEVIIPTQTTAETNPDPVVQTDLEEVDLSDKLVIEHKISYPKTDVDIPWKYQWLKNFFGSMYQFTVGSPPFVTDNFEILEDNAAKGSNFSVGKWIRVAGRYMSSAFNPNIAITALEKMYDRRVFFSEQEHVLKRDKDELNFTFGLEPYLRLGMGNFASIMKYYENNKSVYDILKKTEKVTKKIFETYVLKTNPLIWKKMSLLEALKSIQDWKEGEEAYFDENERIFMARPASTTEKTEKEIIQIDKERFFTYEAVRGILGTLMLMKALEVTDLLASQSKRDLEIHMSILSDNEELKPYLSSLYKFIDLQSQSLRGVDYDVMSSIWAQLRDYTVTSEDPINDLQNYYLTFLRKNKTETASPTIMKKAEVSSTLSFGEGVKDASPQETTTLVQNANEAKVKKKPKVTIKEDEKLALPPVINANKKVEPASVRQEELVLVVTEEQIKVEATRINTPEPSIFWDRLEILKVLTSLKNWELTELVFEEGEFKTKENITEKERQITLEAA